MILGHQLAAKIYSCSPIPQEPLISIFHEWIRRAVLPGHLLIDVADYRHVPEGPGVMIIGHEAQLGADEGPDGSGILYTRRRDQPGNLVEKVRDVLQWTASVAALLESESAFETSFDANRIRVSIRSRLTVVDHETATRDLEQAVTRVAGDLGASSAVVEGRVNLRQLVTADLDGGGAFDSVAGLAERLGAPALGVAKPKLNVL